VRSKAKQIPAPFYPPTIAVGLALIAGLLTGIAAFPERPENPVSRAQKRDHRSEVGKMVSRTIVA